LETARPQWWSAETGGAGQKILVSETYTFPDSLGAMGFDLKDSGFHIMLAKDVPEMIGAKIGGLVSGFLGAKRPEAGRDQRMDPAPRRSASARQCGNAVGF